MKRQLEDLAIPVPGSASRQQLTDLAIPVPGSASRQQLTAEASRVNGPLRSGKDCSGVRAISMRHHSDLRVAV